MLTAKSDEMTSTTLTWGAWYGDQQLELAFPRSWKVSINEIVDAPRLMDHEIENAIQGSLEKTGLIEKRTPGKTVAIGIEDITRPIRFERILMHLLSGLAKGGIDRNNIQLIICNGAHAPMTKSELNKKLGREVCGNFHVLNHNSYENLTDTGIVLGKTPVRINRAFMEADIRILLGSIIPHSFAGFSAGAKLILPGLADIATLERSHKYVMMGFRGGVNDVEVNKFRGEIEWVAKQIGVDFFVGVVPNSKREISGVFAGDVVEAHRAGVDFARKIYKTEIKPPYDVVIFNAYPKDSELLQADTAMTPLKTIEEELLTPDGTIVVVSRCSNGLGYHGLFGTGMRLSRKPIKRRYLKGRDLIILAPGINPAEYKTLYWDGYHLAQNWDSALSRLKSRFAEECRVAVFPTAPLQLLIPA